MLGSENLDVIVRGALAGRGALEGRLGCLGGATQTGGQQTGNIPRADRT